MEAGAAWNELEQYTGDEELQAGSHPGIKVHHIWQKGKTVCLGNYKLVQLKHKAHVEKKLEMRIKGRRTMKLQSSHLIQCSVCNKMNIQKSVHWTIWSERTMITFVFMILWQEFKNVMERWDWKQDQLEDFLSKLKGKRQIKTRAVGFLGDMDQRYWAGRFKATWEWWNRGERRVSVWLLKTHFLS